MVMGLKPYRTVLNVSLVVSLSWTAVMVGSGLPMSAAEEPATVKAELGGTSTKESTEAAAKTEPVQEKEDSAPSKSRKRSKESTSESAEPEKKTAGKYDKRNRQYSENQLRHQDEGYYSQMLPAENLPPPPPLSTIFRTEPLPPPAGSPPPPPPRAAAPIKDKFDDDTGNTGSITATRAAKKAKEMLETGHWDIAKKSFRESLNVDDRQPDLYPGYWECCIKAGDFSEAARALEKLFELDPNKKKDYLWAYGTTLYDLRKYDKAIPALKESLKYGQNLDQVHGALLKIALQRGNPAEIGAEYAALAKVAPGDAKMQLEYGKWLEGQGRNGEAISRYKVAANLRPTDGWLLSRIGYMLMYYNKDFNGAIQYYQRAQVGDPANAAVYAQHIQYAQSQMKNSGPKVQQ